MKKKIATILVFLITFNTYGAGLKDFYLSYQTDKGTVFFVQPQKLHLISGSPANKDIYFDFTYVHPTDSVRILSTITLPTVCRITNLNIGGQDFATVLVYTTPSKKNITYRLESYIPYSLWNIICTSATPLAMTFSDKESRSWTFGFTEQEWKKRRLLFQQLTELIHLQESYE